MDDLYYRYGQQIILHNLLKLDKMRHQSICFVIIVFFIIVVVLEVIFSGWMSQVKIVVH